MEILVAFLVIAFMITAIIAIAEWSMLSRQKDNASATKTSYNTNEEELLLKIEKYREENEKLKNENLALHKILKIKDKNQLPEFSNITKAKDL